MRSRRTHPGRISTKFQSSVNRPKIGILKRNFAHIFIRSLLSRMPKIRPLELWEGTLKRLKSGQNGRLALWDILATRYAVPLRIWGRQPLSRLLDTLWVLWYLCYIHICYIYVWTLMSFGTWQKIFWETSPTICQYVLGHNWHFTGPQAAGF